MRSDKSVVGRAAREECTNVVFLKKVAQPSTCRFSSPVIVRARDLG